ncbi:MAG: hypothetical protein M0C28_07075 [Candidatus Moduliflexus flocculans]|nr:hypothetical protein [Candidatus Moduliflexus flocculans]
MRAGPEAASRSPSPSGSAPADAGYEELRRGLGPVPAAGGRPRRRRSPARPSSSPAPSDLRLRGGGRLGHRRLQDRPAPGRPVGAPAQPTGRRPWPGLVAFYAPQVRLYTPVLAGHHGRAGRGDGALLHRPRPVGRAVAGL